MKKTKKIILAIIVAIISVISVFSCVKGKYTPEPILSPVSVLKPANSVNDNVFSPTGTYDYIYINTSYTFDTWSYFVNDFSYDVYLPSGTIPSWEGIDKYFYPLYIDSVTGESIMLSKSIYLNDSRSPICNLDVLNINTFVNTEYIVDNINSDPYWRLSSNPLQVSLNNGVTTFNFMGNDYAVGNKNDLFKNIISPVPFLFEGTSDNISWTSTGLDNPNNIQNIYFNTNLSNTAIKNILDTYIGTTTGIDIFNYTNGGVLVRCHIINNSANAFIQIIGGSTTLYKWIYDSIDTEESIWWYGIDPSIIDNGNVITSPQGNSLNGFNIYELRALFSSANDFVEQPSGDSYEQGYQDGYQAGYSAGETAGYNSGYSTGYDNGYSSGVNNVTSNPNDYNLYTYNQYQGNYTNGYNAGEEDGYNRGYLDGLDDGADTNISFQYVESVLTLIGNFLNIEVLPGIKLSYALGIVIILTIISIIKMVVK